jgi:hypothetical protein
MTLPIVSIEPPTKVAVKEKAVNAKKMKVCCYPAGGAVTGYRLFRYSY